MRWRPKGLRDNGSERVVVEGEEWIEGMVLALSQSFEGGLDVVVVVPGHGTSRVSLKALWYSQELNSTPLGSHPAFNAPSFMVVSHNSSHQYPSKPVVTCDPPFPHKTWVDLSKSTTTVAPTAEAPQLPLLFFNHPLL